MREFVSDLQSERKVFIGDFDSYTIIKHGISPNELLKLSKFGLLLFDKLMLPAAFFWQTEEMAQLQLRLEQAIRLGYILPIIRDSGCTRDIRDYHGRREVESEKIAGLEVFQRPELASEIASSQDADQVKLLDDLKSFAHLDKKSIRDVYVENWLSDLENHREVNSLNLLVAQCNISEDDRMVIYQELSNITKQELFSRAFCIETIEKLVPSGGCQRLLDERASWLYLKSNADAYSSSFYYSRDPYNGMVFEDNLQLLAKTLSVFGLTDAVISTLTIEQILNIRASVEYKCFITLYRELIKKVYTKQENIIDVLQNKINHIMVRENTMTHMCNCINTIQRNSGAIFLGLLINYLSGSSVSNALLVGVGGATLVPSVIKRFDRINTMMKSRDFSNFKDFIIEKKYETQLYGRCEIER